MGVEPKKDIAVLRVSVDAAQPAPLEVGQPAEPLTVGQKTIAIGNPFGLDHTLTTGVVSAFGREVQGIGGVSIRDMIQTDAAINPGNSGGPLLDSAGRLIGMNTMIFSQTGAYAGIGLAVPSNTIARVVPQLIKSGRVTDVGLGVRIDPSGRLEQRMRLKGVVILAVPPGSAAAEAGLRGLQVPVSPQLRRKIRRAVGRRWGIPAHHRPLPTARRKHYFLALGSFPECACFLVWWVFFLAGAFAAVGAFLAPAAANAGRAIEAEARPMLEAITMEPSLCMDMCMISVVL